MQNSHRFLNITKTLHLSEPSQVLRRIRALCGPVCEVLLSCQEAMTYQIKMEGVSDVQLSTLD